MFAAVVTAAPESQVPETPRRVSRTGEDRARQVVEIALVEFYGHLFSGGLVSRVATDMSSVAVKCAADRAASVTLGQSSTRFQ